MRTSHRRARHIVALVTSTRSSHRRARHDSPTGHHTSAASELDHGSEFWVELAVYRAVTDEIAPIMAERQRSPLASGPRQYKIMDISVPGMSGLDALRRLREWRSVDLRRLGHEEARPRSSLYVGRGVMTHTRNTGRNLSIRVGDRSSAAMVENDGVSSI